VELLLFPREEAATPSKKSTMMTETGHASPPPPELFPAAADDAGAPLLPEAQRTASPGPGTFEDVRLAQREAEAKAHGAALMQLGAAHATRQEEQNAKQENALKQRGLALARTAFQALWDVRPAFAVLSAAREPACRAYLAFMVAKAYTRDYAVPSRLAPHCQGVAEMWKAHMLRPTEYFAFCQGLRMLMRDPPHCADARLFLIDNEPDPQPADAFSAAALRETSRRVARTLDTIVDVLQIDHPDAVKAAPRVPIIVRPQVGEAVTVFAMLDCNVWTLKQLIVARCGHPSYKQRLYFGQIRLEDNRFKTLGEYGIQSGSIVYIVLPNRNQHKPNGGSGI